MLDSLTAVCIQATLDAVDYLSVCGGWGERRSIGGRERGEFGLDILNVPYVMKLSDK